VSVKPDLLLPGSGRDVVQRPEASAAHDEAIRKQLASILESLPFKTSKRCAALLKHVVEKTLSGDAEILKERTLGIDVFRRDPTYDTNSDPVVRMAAGETRKRLAQYYDEPHHRHEIRIQLPPGSYVPEFHISSDTQLTKETVKLSDAGDASPAEYEAFIAVDHDAGWPSARAWYRRKLLVPALCALLGLGSGLVAGRLHEAVSSAPLTAIDEFWHPLIAESGSVWLCLGQSYAARIRLDPNGARNRFDAGYDLSPSEEKWFPTLNLADSIVLARVAGLLERNYKNYSVHGESDTTFADLSSGPSVLIGSFNNDWTIRLTDQLRFHYELDRDAGQQWIVDGEKPNEKIGLHTVNLGNPDTRDAYAVISRLQDPSTGKFVVALAGVSTNGTEAAGKFVSDPGYFDGFAKHAPADWKNRNLQIVIAASIVDGSPGPPHVVSSYVW
jgi:hypothetical protein